MERKHTMKMRWMVATAVALPLATSFAEPQGKPGQGPAKGPPPFEEMDENGDGKIALGEFVEAHQKMLEQRFRRIDENNDGFLSQGEMESARERMQKRRGPGQGGPAGED